jgi:hypothetical protein
MYSLIYIAFSKSIRFATRSWGTQGNATWSPFLAVHHHRRTVVRAYKTDLGVFDAIRPDRNFDKCGWVRSYRTQERHRSHERDINGGKERDATYAELVYVTFARPPGKSAPTATSSGGLVKLRLKAAGRYRISTDAPLWIDVIAGSDALTSSGFQGRQPCALLHKSVEWALPGGVDLIVQLSGAARDRAKLAVTPVRSAAAAVH